VDGRRRWEWEESRFVEVDGVWWFRTEAYLLDVDRQASLLF
jgi:hypothetical protein